jgi:hypothetical protein
MSTESLPQTPSERADRLATNVHTLWGLHRQRFAERLKAADEEARAYLQQKAADDVAKQENLRAVFAEWKALQTKKAKPRLTDPDPQKRPGPEEDWYWNESTVIGMDEHRNVEKVPIRAWYRRPRAVTPLDFDPPVVAENPSMAMRYAALAAAHDQVWPAEDGKIGRDAPLAAVLNLLRGGRFYGNLRVRVQDIPNGPGFDEGGMERLDAFYDMVKADLLKAVESRPPLSPNAAFVLDILKALPPGWAKTGPQILDALAEREPPVYLDESTLTSHIMPLLKEHYGVKNQPRIGYYVPAS